MLQRPKNNPSGLNDENHKQLISELTKYAQEGASDEDLRRFKETFIAQKKKSVSQPTSQENVLASKPKQKIIPTSSATEETQAPVELDGLDGPPKMKTFTGLTPEEQQTLQAKPAIKVSKSSELIGKKLKLQKELSTIKVTPENQEEVLRKTDELSAVIKAQDEISNSRLSEIENQFKEAKNEEAVDLEANKRLDDLLTNTGVWNNIKSKSLNVYNNLIDQAASITDEPGIRDLKADLDPLSEEKKEIKKDAANKKISLSDDQINELAKKLYKDKQADYIETDNINSFLDNLDENDKNLLKQSRKQTAEHLQESNLKEEKVINAYEVIGNKKIKEYKDLEQQLLNYKNNNQALPKDIYDSYVSLGNEIVGIGNTIQKKQSVINKNKEDLGTAQQEFDLLKRRYGDIDNAISNIGLGGSKILNGILGFTNYAAKFGGGLQGELYSNAGQKVTNKINDYISEEEGQLRKSVESIESPEGFINYVSDIVAKQIPNLVATSTGIGGLGVIGISSTGEKFTQMNKEVLDGKATYSPLEMAVAPALWGSAEVISEIPTLSILTKGGRVFDSIVKNEGDLIAKSVKEKAKEWAKDWSVDMSKEVAGEEFTNFTQNFTDKYVLGKKDVGLLDNAGTVLKDTFTLTNVLKAAPHVAGAILKSHQNNSDLNILDENSKKIIEFSKQLENESLNDTEKAVINRQIEKATAQNSKIIANTIEKVNNMPDDVYRKIIDLNNKVADIKTEAFAINEGNLPNKEELIKSLESDYRSAQMERNALIDAKYEPTEEVVVEEVKPVEVISPETSSNYANLTENKDGDFVFFHVGGKGYDKIKKSTGGTIATSKEEAGALSKVGGVAMYYTKPDDTERMVSGEAKYAVTIPKEKVYDANTDPNNYAEQAKVIHEEENPGKAFDANTKAAYITKIAGENGYDMVVSEWMGKTRAQTTKEFSPTDVELKEGSTIVKPFEEQYAGNIQKGFKAIVPESKEAKFKAVYDQINAEKNKVGEYDTLYGLASKEISKINQDEVTKLVEEDSTLSQETKDMYAEALAYEPEQRRTVNVVGETVEVKNAPEGHHLNIGLLEGRTNKRMSTEDILSKLPNDIEVISSSEVEGTEPTISMQISRPLTSSEMVKLLDDTKQQAIAQLSDKKGILYDVKRGTKDGWGEFNPEFFVTQDGKNLTEVKPTVAKSKLEAFKAKYINKPVYDRTKLDTQVENAKKSLSKILPDVKFVVHDTNESFIGIAGKSGRGYYDPATKTIHINALDANARTVAHEVFHSVLLDKVKTDANARDLTKRMISSIAKTLEGNPDLKKTLDDFIKNYDENVQSEEKMAELFGYLADGYEGFDAPTKSIIKRAMDRLAKMFGLKPFTEGEIVDMLKTLSGKVATGEEIVSKDVEIISKIDNSESFENEYISTNGTVVDTPSKRFALTDDTVIKESDIIDSKILVGKPLEVVYYDNFTSSPYKLKNRVSGSEVTRTGEGGPGYSYRPEIKKNGMVAAFTNVTKGLNLIQGIRSRNKVANENAVVGVALQNKETGHLGNKTTERDFYSPIDGVIVQAINDKLITEDQAVEMLKGAVDAYGQTKKGSDSKSSLGFTSDDFSTLDEFYKKINSISFERRGTFNSMAIPSKSDLKITKSTKPYVKIWLDSGIPTLNEYYDATSEKYTKEAEPHDIVKYFDPNLNEVGVDSTVKVTDAEIKRAKAMGVEIRTIDDKLSHTSYPVVLFGKNIGVPSKFNSVRDMSENWNVPNPFFQAGRRGDKAEPIRIPELIETSKAPNVNKGRLQEIESPKFKKWFGDWENNPEKSSKVVDENGKPLIVYHGGPIFEKFNKGTDKIDKGIYFTDNKYFALYFAHQNELAERDKRGFEYSDIPEELLESGDPFPEKYLKYSKIYRAYLDIKNPTIKESINANLIPYNYEKNKDGFIAKSTGDFGYKGGQYVVFDDSQILQVKDSRMQESESYSDMKDIVQDMIDDGMSVTEIKKTISSELGADQVSLAERAYNELTTVKEEVVATNDVEAFRDKVKELPQSGIVGKYLSGETIEKVEGEAPRNAQETEVMSLIDAGMHGKETVAMAKEVYGDKYIEKTLEFLDTANLKPHEKAVLYVSLENEMFDRVNLEPDNVGLKKLQDLVRAKSQQFLRESSLAINAGRLRAIMKDGFNYESVTDKFLSSDQLRDKKAIEKAIQSDSDAIQQEYENIVSESDLEQMILSGVEKQVNEIYKKLPTARRVKADKAIAALEKIQDKLRGRAYDATIGVPIALIDSSITIIKNSIKAGVSIADAIEIGINHIKERYGNNWANEDMFRKDMTEGFKTEGITEKEIKAKELSNKEIVKQALIDAGFGKEITVRTKQGKVKRDVLDWKKLAGEEGSVDKIRENVEGIIGKDAAKELEDEYNNLRASIIEKSLNELENRNTPRKKVDLKTSAKKLAELYNYGLFEKESDTYDRLINTALGMNQLDQKSFDEAKSLAKSLSELFSQEDSNGNKLSQEYLKFAERSINKKIESLLSKIAWSQSNGAYKAVVVAKEFIGLAQRNALVSVAQAIENTTSGYISRVFKKIGFMFDNVDTKAMKASRNKLAKMTFKDITMNAGLEFGDVTSPFITKSKTMDLIVNASDSRLYHALTSTALGKPFLESADSMHKAALAQGFFHYNLIKILRKKGMSKTEAKNYVSENLTGQSFEDALVTSKQIIDKINENAGKKVISDSKESIYRFANDLVNESLVQGNKITLDELEASLKSAETVAGFELGHEPNNIISKPLNLFNSWIQTRTDKAVKEKKWNDAAALTAASIVTTNILNPYVGGGTNWTLLAAQKAGIPTLSTIYWNIKSRGSKLDLSTEEGMKNLEKDLKYQLLAKNANARMFIGAAVTLAAFALAKSTGADDDLYEWLKKNEWAKKYMKKMNPPAVQFMLAQKDKKLGEFLGQQMNIKADAFDEGKKLQQALKNAASGKTQKALGGAGQLVGSRLSTPIIPWRVVKDVRDIYRGLNGLPPIEFDYKSSGFGSGYFQGGMIEQLGLRPENVKDTEGNRGSSGNRESSGNRAASGSRSQSGSRD